MNVAQWLREAQQRLQNADIETARLDAVVLLEDCLSTNRTHLLAHPETELTTEQLKTLTKQLERRAQHEPLAYIRGKSEFYGREFIVSPAVLEPRPESETMIELLKRYAQEGTFGRDHPVGTVSETDQLAIETGSSLQCPERDANGTILRIADVGSGSGAVGITAALELSNVHVELLEIDDAAIEIAKRNVIYFATDIPVIKSDLLWPVQGAATRQTQRKAIATHEYDILLCNLPYVPDEHTINQAATFEPRLAIFGGQDGLDLYRQLFAQLAQLARKPLLILCESLPAQHEMLAAIATTAGYRQDAEDDFIQAFVLA